MRFAGIRFSTVIIVTLIFLTATAYWLIFHLPLSAEINRLKTKLSSLKDEISVKEMEYKRLKETLSRSDYSYIIREILTWEDVDTGVFLSKLSYLAGKSGVDLMLVEPESQRKIAGHEGFPFRLVAEGNYESMTTFIKGLEEIPFLIISDIELKEDPKKRGLIHAQLLANLLSLKIDKQFVEGIHIPSDDGGKIKSSAVERDPFQPPFLYFSIGKGEVMDIFKGVELKGIIDIEGKKAAIINGQIMHEGDSIKGFDIKRIERKRLILQKKDVQYYLELKD